MTNKGYIIGFKPYFQAIFTLISDIFSRNYAYLLAFIRYAAGKPGGSSYRMNAANHYFPGCEKKHHPMKRIQASAIRWVKKFCLGRSRAKNISATMNNTMVAMAIRPATLRFFIIVYLRCSASGSLCTSSHSPLWWHLHFRNSIPSTIVRIPGTYVP